MAKIRTGYSFRTAAGHLPDVMARVKELGWPAAPITDRMSTHGYVRWTKLCDKNGIRPVYGVEIPCVSELGARKPVVDYWTFFAKSDLGPIHELIYKATNNEGKEPSLLYTQALTQEGVYIISGERLQIDELPATPSHFYVGLSPATPLGLVRKAQKAGLQFAATSDNLYPRPEDKEFYRVALGRRATTQTYPLHILDDDELRAYLEQDYDQATVDQAFVNRDLILGGCNTTLKKAKLLVPEKPKTLRLMCEEGAQRTGVDLNDPVYGDRLTFELERIAEKDFEDYFYILADMIAYAKTKMVVGPARGSSCGSLVCYLLAITSIDPIPYGLIFERFIDTNRKDLPDVDIDFSDAKRHLVFEYAENKYGRERVAKLGTVGMFQARSALNGAAAALRIPSWRINKLLDSIIIRSSGDSRAMNTLEDTLKETEQGRLFFDEHPEAIVATRMEGHPQLSSQHAAGLLLTDSPITDYVAMDARGRTAWCDKKDAEYLNLLKIDALGLTQLSIFERTLELIGEKPTSDFLEAIPLDDPAAFAVLNKKQFSGIFQVTGVAVRSLANQIHFDKLDDLIALGAIARPGPLASGGTMAWISRRNGAAVPAQVHPMLDDLTKETYGVVIYQETVMRICRELGKFTWAEVSDVRQAMSRRLGDEFFGAYWVKFRDGCKENGIDENTSKKIWDQINSFGSWAFNKCLSGSTKIRLGASGSHLPNEMTIEELYDRYEANPTPWIKQKGVGPVLVSMHNDGRGYPQTSVRIHKSGRKRCNRYEFSDGTEVVCTPEHKFIVEGEWKPIGDAQIGDSFASLEVQPQEHVATVGKGGHLRGKQHKGLVSGKEHPGWTNGASVFKEQFADRMLGEGCQDCGTLHDRMEVHHNDFDHGRIEPESLAWLCPSCHKKRHYDNGRVSRFQKGYSPAPKTLVLVEDAGEQETYDIEMPVIHNFLLANGLVTHNSHAVAYGVVSYWCCWLKAHHPLAFAAATLDAEPLPDKQLNLLRELDAEGIKYVPVDAEHSVDRWAIAEREGKQILVGPLSMVKGIGPAVTIDILQARRSGEALKPGVIKKLTNAKTEIDSLYPIEDRIRELHPDLAALNIFTPQTLAFDVKPGIKGEFLLLARVRAINPRDENEAINVQKRNGKILTGPTQSLNLFFMDDSDEIFCKIDRFKYASHRDIDPVTGVSRNFGRWFMDTAKAGKSLFAIKGTCPPDFRMVKVINMRYLGEMENARLPEGMRATTTDSKLMAGEQS